MTLTIWEAATKFRNGTLTPEALTEELLGRIQKENPRLNAYYEVFGKAAREAASQATRELREGKDRGPLHGIPIGVKDLYDVAGSVTTAGAHKGFHPAPADEDCEVVARLRAAGAVFLGKTALHEWALGVSSNNAHFGPTRNPHEVDRIPGGSSGGSGAALAAGLCVAALGSDTGGSIRIPAALCGVWGLKPTYGKVSLRGVVPLSRSLDHAGPMANAAEDLFVLLEAMCDFRRAPAPRPRVLVPKNYFFDEVDPGVADLVCVAAAKVGAVEFVDVKDPAAAWQANSTILLCEAATVHEERLKTHPEWFGDSLGPRLRGGLETKGVDYVRARDVQREWIAFLTRLLGEDAVLAVPATPIPATAIGDRDGAPIARIMTRFTAPFNLAGLPVLSVPAGKVGGLPAGMQLVAGPGRENLLRAAARTP